jgi:hypothetical protein
MDVSGLGNARGAAAARRAAAVAAPARSLRAVLPAAGLVATGALLFPASGRDDVYLTCWPAQTLAATGAIRNLNGEAVEQSSSLLHVALLGVLARLSPEHLPELAVLASAAIGAGCVLLAARGARRLGPAYAGAPWLVATATGLVYWAFSGMETSLAAWLGLAAVLAWSEYLGDTGRCWPGPAAWLATAGFAAVRPEGAFVLGATALSGLGVAAVSGGAVGSGFGRWLAPRLARLLAVVAAAFALLAAFRWWSFGSAFPQPVAAKSFTRLADAPLDRLLAGLDYLFASVGSIADAALWVAAAGAALALRGARRGRAPVFDVVAGLYCAAYAGFAVTTGGDYMEGPRYLVPALPVAALLAAGALTRGVPERRRAALAALVALQLAGTLAFARTQSTGVPLWEEWPDLGAPFGWSEAGNRVHLRDVALVRALGEAVDEVAAGGVAPVSVLSRQMGMVAYYTAQARPGRVRFIDAYGLATRHLTEPGFAPLREKWRRDRFAVLFEQGARLESLWGVGRPDVLYDLGEPPPGLADAGYDVVFRQGGELRVRSLSFPGAPVKAAAWIAVRRDRRAAADGS